MLRFIVSILLVSHIFTSTDLYVGYPDKENNFEKVQEAVNSLVFIYK